MTKAKIHRILLVLEPSSPLKEALQAAAELAKEQHAELHLMFGQSSALREVAALPFSREIEFQSSIERQLSPQQLDRSLRSLARQLQRAFEQTLKASRLRGSFLLQQDPLQQLRRQCGGGDVLWLSPATLLIRIPAARRARRDTLYLAYRASPAGVNALTVAANLLRRGYRRLVILTQGDEEVAALAEMFRMPFEVVRLGKGYASLLQQIEPRATNTLLLPDDCLPGEEADRLLSDLAHSRLEVLLVH